ncbi:hypothetical protein ACS0TY_025138 [Phlomoides rotata]
MILHLHSAAVHLSNASRKLLVNVSVNSLSVNKGKLEGSMVVEPEKAVENGLRKKPPTSSNPTQNK